MAQDPRALLQKADKAASSASGGFSMFGGRTEKWENAAELYIQAANAFRMQKANTDAGASFEKAASIQLTQLSEPDDQANTLIEAYKTYRKSSPADAARVLSVAITQYTSKGNFRRAATHQQNLAELYEQELNEPKKGLQAYETAAGWFEADGAQALADKLFLKVGELAALEGEYARAAGVFEGVARGAVGSNLMRWSVKDYLLKAGICQLCTGDLVAVKRALESYADIDHSFQTTREGGLLVELVDMVEKGDQEGFAGALFRFDQLSKLDKWKTTLLLRVKNGIEEQGEDFS